MLSSDVIVSLAMHCMASDCGYEGASLDSSLALGTHSNRSLRPLRRSGGVSRDRLSRSYVSAVPSSDLLNPKSGLGYWLESPTVEFPKIRGPQY